MGLTLILFFLIPVEGMPQQPVASHKVHNGFLKAGAYLDMDEGSRRGYVMGILDGIYTSPFFGAPDDNKALVSLATCVEGMKASQVAAIIEKYIRNHPEHWHLDLKEQFLYAMREACPINEP
jgi:hypothetical protein